MKKKLTDIFATRYLLNALFILLAGMALAVNAAPNIAPTDALFVQAMFLDGRTAIEMSQQAVVASSHNSVKKLAQRIINERSAANEQLRVLATNKKLDLPTGLDAAHQQRVDQLKTASTVDFDKLYAEQLQHSNELTMAMAGAVAKNPHADVELRVFATRQMSTLKKQQLSLIKQAAIASKALATAAKKHP